MWLDRIISALHEDQQDKEIATTNKQPMPVITTTSDEDEKPSSNPSCLTRLGRTVLKSKRYVHFTDQSKQSLIYVTPLN
ncbi:unnamed protein product [Schistosoma margrebowiei]|uniref:Uncharacterized protein n=1 Tax=Schistosoma margrebowiei TaxID=48269 RepID=A0A183LPL3_9TREM|nr:unnamed protein product [Schistosoma margrebowiei]